jgi:hypothetical protein
MKHAQWFADGNYIGPAELPTLIKVNTTAPGMEREEVESIARLIAAAPDLLAALKTVADYWAGGDVPPEIDTLMRAAIAQAMEGQS